MTNKISYIHAMHMILLTIIIISFTMPSLNSFVLRTNICLKSLHSIRNVRSISKSQIKMEQNEMFVIPTQKPTKNSRSMTFNASDPLSIQISNAYKEYNTDGIQELIAQNPLLLHNHSAYDLFEASIEASNGKASDIASMMNGLIACCVNFTHPDNNQAKKALQLLDIMKKSSSSTSSLDVCVIPDIVSYSCAYSACTNTDIDNEFLMDEMLQMSKKQAGSYRRKRINANKRNQFKSSNRSHGTKKESIYTKIQTKHPDFEILYEDDNYIGVCKPSTMVCYHRHKTSKGKYDDISLEDLLWDYMETKTKTTTTATTTTRSSDTLSTINPDGFGIVHRLDRGTSGCILLAKTNEAHAHLLTAFFKRQVYKSYLALLPAQPQYNINNKNHPILENDPLGSDLIVGTTGMIDIPVHGKPALSSYTIEHIHSSPPKAISVRMETYTGRKHQVRIHCAYGLKRPLFLEPEYHSTQRSNNNNYNIKTKTNKQSINKQNDCISSIPSAIEKVGLNVDHGHQFFLHAQSLKVPFLNIELDAPLPQWWTQTIDEL